MRILLILLMVLLPVKAWGAIALDAETVSKNSEIATTCNFTHTAIGTPTVALLWVALDADMDISPLPTWGGTSMVLVAEGALTDQSDENVYLYELHSPGTGGKTVDADFDSIEHSSCIAQTFTGTHATDATVESTLYDNAGATCTTAATTLTMDATTSWMVTSHSWHGGDTNPFTEASYTATVDTETGGASSLNDSGFGAGSSTGTSGSVTHTTTPTLTDECSQISVELIVAASSAGTIYGASMEASNFDGDM